MLKCTHAWSWLDKCLCACAVNYAGIDMSLSLLFSLSLSLNSSIPPSWMDGWTCACCVYVCAQVPRRYLCIPVCMHLHDRADSPRRGVQGSNVLDERLEQPRHIRQISELRHSGELSASTSRLASEKMQAMPRTHQSLPRSKSARLCLNSPSRLLVIHRN